MNRKSIVWCLLLSAFLALAGCDSDDIPEDPTPEPSPATTSTSVVPSLGLIDGASVAITDLDGNEVGTATLGDTGIVTITYPAATSGPLIINVSGADGATYFDESVGAFVPFPEGASMRAVIAGPLGEVAVTPLTEMAAALFAASGGSTAADADTANETVRSQFIPGIDNILSPPTLIGSTDDELGNTAAGLYGAFVGALAHLATGVDSPALAVMTQLSADFSDGVLDNAVNGEAITSLAFNATAAGFAAQVGGAIEAIVAAYGGSDLSAAVLAGIIGDALPDPVIDGGTGSGGGDDGTGGGDDGSGGGDDGSGGGDDGSGGGDDGSGGGDDGSGGGDDGTGGGDGGGDGGGNNAPVGGDALPEDLSFGPGFDPEFPATIPTPTDPGVATDLRNEIPGLYETWRTQVRARITDASQATNVFTQLTQGGSEVTMLDAEGNSVREVTLSNGPDGLPGTEDDIVTAYRGYDTVGAGNYEAVHPGEDNTWFTEDDVFTEGIQIVAEVVSEGNLVFALGQADFTQTLSHGLDERIFTRDDLIGGKIGYVIAELDGEGNRGTAISLNGEGPDRELFTTDDDVLAVSLASYDGNQNAVQTVTFTSDGPDNAWFTADDQIGTYVLGVIGADNRMRYLLTYDGDGADNEWFTADDNLRAITALDYDSAGRVIYNATHTSAGADGAWFTADDNGSALAWVYGENGRELRLASSSNIGADAIWFTADDGISSYQIFDYVGDVPSFRVRFVGPGADGAWFTGDDIPQSPLSRSYNSEGQLLRNVNYRSSLGDDGLALTADDVNNYQEYTYGPDGNQAGQVSAQVGDDGVAFTADDVASYGTQRVFEGDRQVATRGIAGIGPDAKWFTDDDVLSNLTVLLYDGGNEVGFNRFGEPGPDGVFGTADDVQTAARQIEPQGDNMQARIDFSGAGDDGSWGTSDDVVSGYFVETLDAAGQIIETVFHNDAGTDGQWFTDDDVISYYQLIEWDANGNQTLSYFVGDTGADGQWFTADDYDTGYTRYAFDAEGNVLERLDYYAPGPDGLYLTADDVITGGEIYDLAPAQIAAAGVNVGTLPDACSEVAGSSGDLTVQVTNGFGQPVPGAVVQLGHDGDTVTTGSDGVASFTGLSGSYDVHVFANDHDWMSWLCVVPEGATELVATLDEQLTHANGYTGRVPSASALPLSSGFLSETSNRTLIALIDDAGAVLGVNLNAERKLDRADTDLFQQRLREILWLPGIAPGTEVTGTLYAFNYSAGSGFLSEVTVVAEAATYTTVPADLNSSGQLPDDIRANAIEIVTNFTNPSRNDLPVIASSFSGQDFRYGNGLGTETFQGLREPLGLPEGFGISQLITRPFGANSITLTAFPDGDVPDSFRPRTADVAVEAFAARVDNEGLPNPVYSWLPATQVPKTTWLAVQRVRLEGNFGDNWTIYAPAGVGEIAFPAIPAGIEESVFYGDTNFFRFDIRAFSAGGLDYQEAIRTRDLESAPVGEDYDETTNDLGGFYP